jgi:hypothetical protein
VRERLARLSTMTAPTELLEHDTLPGRCRRSRFANRWTFPGARRGGKRLDESLISVTCLTVLHKQPLMALNHILEKRRCGILFRTSHSDRKSYNRKKKKLVRVSRFSTGFCAVSVGRLARHFPVSCGARVLGWCRFGLQASLLGG